MCLTYIIYINAYLRVIVWKFARNNINRQFEMYYCHNVIKNSSKTNITDGEFRYEFNKISIIMNRRIEIHRFLPGSL